MTLPHLPHAPYVPPAGSLAGAQTFLDIMRQRRSVRQFSPRRVDEAVIRTCIAAAGSAPSGANKQPWRFVAVSDNITKRAIRDAAEAEEREFYTRRATPEWLADLAPLGTDATKEFLTTAPWLVIVFKLMKTDPDAQGTQGKVYYVDESVGIAAGLFLAACQHAGLATLTHTPSPMGFLSKVLHRPDHERPFLLIPVGYPADDCTVPAITRKPLDQIATFIHSPSTP
jgi:iodotyrosine deiodinase